MVCALDWCQLNNDAYDAWRERLAQAARTTPDRVLLTCVHQHDAPIFDAAAQKMLDANGLPKSMCDLEFMDNALRRVAEAVRESVDGWSVEGGLSPPAGRFKPITHVGVGEAAVREVASNRRVDSPQGAVSWPRNSATRDPAVVAALSVRSTPCSRRSASGTATRPWPRSVATPYTP